ncbi:Uncharacterised protein [Mycobacteroides abscessus subsp. bolletii]|uniref:phage upper tail fiber protein n=1 Tax=Mycobacteroides abscessus TaxID=36809 RepID=UPI0009A62B43|nr:hypothetical protein [Mycobacteroides abscessus]SKX80180.1 Uncharacterised protein [Mycobacteroides abscessus subsp. bolletii]
MTLVVALDLSQPIGERLPPEAIAEIKEVAPSSVENGAITTDKLRDGAVTSQKIAPGAVDDLAIGNGQVKNAALANGAVSEAKIADDAVTPAKCGTGVVTAEDANGAAVEMKVKFVTSTQYAALTTKDPNVLYFTTD